ncbi:MAG: hypothetical protein DRK00_03295 [Thermoprotei archaeon]|nr:MAG: hypothetical protein DRK00_03295 [Thermoprotei archaeon]
MAREEVDMSFEVCGERVTLTHLKVFREGELGYLVGNVKARKLLEIARRHVAVPPPLYATLTFRTGRLTLAPGPSLVSGVKFVIMPEPMEAPMGFGSEFIRALLLRVPKMLEISRAPILVKDLDERVKGEGVKYALDIMERVARVYRVPFIVTGSLTLLGAWSWRHSLVRVYDKWGRSLILVDGRPVDTLP